MVNAAMRTPAEPPTDARIARGVRDLEPVAVHETDALVDQLRAAGQNVLRLYGSPHWLPPAHVIEAARRAVTSTETVPASGRPQLREAIADRLARENDVHVDPAREIVVTNAANHGLAIVLSSVLDPGDEVLTYAPHYYYEGIVRMAGGVFAVAPTSEARGWQWDPAALAAAITPRTKVLLVNTPTNPTGYVAGAEDLRAIVDLAVAHDLLIVSDEAYDHVVYDGARHLSIATLPGAEQRTVTVVSATKSYAMKAWRIGFVAGPASVIGSCRKVLEWNVFSCNHVAQHALEAALTGPQDWVAAIAQRFETCRDLMIGELEGAPGIHAVAPRGGPFLFLRVTELDMDAERFRTLLLREHGVPTDSGRHFGSTQHLRISFGGRADDVAEAGRLIHAAAREAYRGGRFNLSL